MSAIEVGRYLGRAVAGIGKSKASLARTAGLSRPTFNRILRGDMEGVRIGNIIKLAQALDVKADVVVGLYFLEGRETVARFDACSGEKQERV